MTLRPILLLLCAAATLGACSTDGERDMVDYTARVERLRADCEAKGGTLAQATKMTGDLKVDRPCQMPTAAAAP